MAGIKFTHLDPTDFIKQGDVCYIEIPDVEGIHYMAIMNTDPQIQEVIVLGVLTTKIDKRKEFIRRNRMNPDSIVEFTYKKPSAIDCNTLHTIQKHTLFDKIRKGVFKISAPLPEEIVNRIIQGIIAGDAPQYLKKLVIHE